MKNKNHLYQSLNHRIDSLLELSMDYPKTAYLLPEILINTIYYTYEFINDKQPYYNIIEIIQYLGISCIKEEIELLKKIESALRKSDDYQEICKQFELPHLLSIISKLKNKIQEEGFINHARNNR